MSILSTKLKSFQEKVNSAPNLPGCYMYKDPTGKVIYVGKAKILKNRVKSYFNNFDRLETKTQQMIEKAVDIEMLTVDSEVEALILENNLIKKYRPKYNIMMRDDKNYIYVRFEKLRKSTQPIPTKNSWYQDFPRIFIVRNKEKDGAEYFGPYPDSMPAKRILKKLRKLFPFRSTNNLVYVDKDKNVVSSNKKRCFYCHIGLCKGACAGLESKKDYALRFNNIRKFFKGEKDSILKEYESEMKVLSKEMKYEEAAKLRDKINDIKYVTSHIGIDNTADDVVVEGIKKQERKNAIEKLIEELEFPPDKLRNHENFKIECYDISNIQGTNAVGSMTVIVDGQLRPDLYRKFRIKMKNEPNDFAMLQEMLGRRINNYKLSIRNYELRGEKLQDLPFFKRSEGELTNDDLRTMTNDIRLTSNVKRSTTNNDDPSSTIHHPKDPSFSILPDLIIIDGGKGQLASTYRILYNFGLHNEIPIVGLAKKQEEIFKIANQFKDEHFNQINDSDMFKRVLLPRRSESLYLVQRIRDEAHRFGITYHRKLRSKAMTKT